MNTSNNYRNLSSLNNKSKTRRRDTLAIASALLTLGFLVQLVMQKDLLFILEYKWRFFLGVPVFSIIWAAIILYLYSQWRRVSQNYRYWRALALSLLSYLMFSLTMSVCSVILSSITVDNFDLFDPYAYLYVFLEAMLLLSFITLHNLINLAISAPLIFKICWLFDKKS